jgi:anthranilate synthase/aminodeoxychorismate synthase-like glutamine amidotransferase
MSSQRVLVIDNYDSFTWNLVQYLGELGCAVDVVRNDQAAPADLVAKGYDRLVVSPGPCTPNESGISLECVRLFPEAGIPTLGVCLGHQAMAQAFGGQVVRGEPIHGKTGVITHDGKGVYQGLPETITVGRYHSLVVDPNAAGDLEVVATGEDGVVMGVRHPDLPVEGVQFHPESILTECGHAMLANFLNSGDPSDQ